MQETKQGKQAILNLVLVENEEGVETEVSPDIRRNIMIHSLMVIPEKYQRHIAVMNIRELNKHFSN